MAGYLILTSQKLILSTNYMLFLYGLFTIFMFSLLDRYMNEVSSMDFLYLGLFDAMVALPLFSFKYPDTSYGFLFLGLSIIPLLKLYQAYCNSKYFHFIKLVNRFAVVVTIAVFLLDNVSIFPVEHSDTFIYIILFIGLLLTTFLAANIYREKSITPIFSSANLILILSIIGGTLGESIEIIILGILIFSIVATVALIDNFVKEYRNETLIYMREKLVYKDILTSMKNRQSFEKQLKEDDKNINDFNSYWAISIDLSDIKYVNNNFGYSHGDKLIQNLADSIENTFEDIGNCFRICGDEFIILIKNEPKEKVERYIELFQSVVSSYNKLHDIKMITSLGYDSYKFGYDKSIFDLVSRTDYMMCKNKRRFKTSWMPDENEELQE
ncbi:diguanylate cyclase domain-containing protein [Peptoclostridium sp. AF21-18]|uniref:diguanylate cyclase domain-containing protein n=1 Tax=Peptoclostridium sp. AF21-18 TaxID=2292243 RepID=UPI000E4FDC92|nr:diguanylate cyclase [Peptoclostridium sp. AF21-18]RHQ98369.1 diguanylate cyclase [Peptoclostridium sp. AF21-18]